MVGEGRAIRALTRPAAFAAVLGVTFGAAALVGGSLDPLRGSDDPQEHAEGRTSGHSGGHAAAAMEPSAETVQAPAGLAVAQEGYRLALESASLPLGRPAELRFRVLGRDGAPVEDFAEEHGRKMHLIVVRRDLTGYQHLHPTMGAGGRWSVRLTLPEAGAYRAYADFSAGGRSVTLGTDLVVAGPFHPRALPAPRATETVAGYAARLEAENLVAGGEAELTYDMRRDDAPVDDIQPYLGADGHLVALREADLAFLHVHPEESSTPGRIRFGASLPSAGRYRLFLQFKHAGRVRTVAHTLEVPS